MGSKHLGSKKIFGPKIFGSKQNFGSKNNLVKKILDPKTIVQQILGLKNFLVRKTVGSI